MGVHWGLQAVEILPHWPDHQSGQSQADHLPGWGRAGGPGLEALEGCSFLNPCVSLFLVLYVSTDQRYKRLSATWKAWKVEAWNARQLTSAGQKAGQDDALTDLRNKYF